MTNEYKSYLKEQENRFLEILNLSLSDYIYAIELFNEWKSDILEKFSCYRNESICVLIDDYIVTKEIEFNNFLNGIPEYYNYITA